MDFIEYCKNLKSEDWRVQVTDKWTVKDVVAHMVGWEKVGVEALEKYLKIGGNKPWFMESGDYDNFNTEQVEFYKNHSPKELLKEWQDWQIKIEKLIKKIGEKKLRINKDMEWLFDEEKEDGHYKHHLDQIKKALNKQNA